MSFNDSSAVTVSTTATKIASASTSRTSILIKNNDSSIVLYIGQNSSVTTSNGMPIAGGQSFSDSGVGCHKGEWWGVAASSTVNVRVIDQYEVKVGGTPAGSS